MCGPFRHDSGRKRLNKSSSKCHRDHRNHNAVIFAKFKVNEGCKGKGTKKKLATSVVAVTKGVTQNWRNVSTSFHLLSKNKLLSFVYYTHYAFSTMHRFVTLHLIIVYVCIILGSVASFQPPFAVTSRTKPSSASISIARLQQSDRFDVVEDRFGIRAQQHVSKWPALLNKRNWSLQKVRSYLWSHRRRILACSLALILCLALSQSAFAVTGGRMGGSFSRSGSGASMGRSYLPPSSYRGNPFSNSRAVFGSPASSTRLYSSQLKSHVATKFTALDAALWTGTGALLSYGAYNNYKKRDGTSPLGPGGTVASITLSLDVSDPRDSGSIVQRLRRISDQANTSTRQGVQDLVMDVCMEISRQERSIVSAATDFQHHGTVALAQREFQRHSVRNRSKFDRDGGKYEKVLKAIDLLRGFSTVYFLIHNQSTSLVRIISQKAEDLRLTEDKKHLQRRLW
jgi:hypothetical protein